MDYNFLSLVIVYLALSWNDTGVVIAQGNDYNDLFFLILLTSDSIFYYDLNDVVRRRINVILILAFCAYSPVGNTTQL